MGRRCLKQARRHVFRFHRAGEQILTIEDERRDARDPAHLRSLRFEADFFSSGGAFQEGSDDTIGQTCMFRNIDQHFCVADIAALNEIGAEQSFDDGVLHTFMELLRLGFGFRLSRPRTIAEAP
jgi:hypothetical protein